MIHVKDLTKTYGTIRAISGIEFDIQAGEVVGLLGPNGAGKTTTMRILCGCIGSTEGSIQINGIDLDAYPQKAKATIGYLPERPPLYKEMTVSDFVRFAASVQGVNDVEEATTHALTQVGLTGDVGGTPISHRIIGRLSKGYQQRVGLAAALVHRPAVLVLDEPTSGLDPAQRKELRDLLAELARNDNRTVLISSHILTEIETLCDRVIVINNGRVIAEDRIDNLRTAASTIEVRVEHESAELATKLEALAGVQKVVLMENGALTVSMDSDCRPAVATCAAPHGLLEMHRTDGLEEIYLRLTEGSS